MSNTSTTKSVPVEKMLKAMQDVDLLPKPDQWLLIDPQGRVYRGRIEDIFPVMVQHHPGMKWSKP